MSVAQDATPSLADAAKQAGHEGKPKSKIVVTDDNLKSRQSPFPDINFEGDINTDEIIASISNYRISHSLKETEDATHEWFTHFDDMMMRLIRENNQINVSKLDRDFDPDKYPNDYRQARQRITHDIQTDVVDRRTVMKNAVMIGRIQQTMMQVRSILFRSGWRFDWMKIHSANGMQTF